MKFERRSPSLSGLGDVEARRRLASDGYNELPRPDRRTPFRIVIEVLREPMFGLLLVGGIIYLALGDITEALILLAFATLSIVITAVQETRTERVLETLRDLTSPRALVLRDGKLKRIAGREVVQGDLIRVSEGDRVPADAVLIEARDLMADESMLTGESVPVRKAVSSKIEPQSFHPGGDDQPLIFSGSLVVRGTGVAEVVATGARTEIGKIGHSLRGIETEAPRLQIQTRRLVRVFAAFGMGVSLLAVLLYGIMRGGWLEAFLAGIALGMSMLPEEFPVVLTVFMALGAWRISQARVLTRRAAAIETLGSATVLCTDKTGTLTENRMAVDEFWLSNGKSLTLNPYTGDLPSEFQRLLTTGVLASAPDPVDPMEKAFHDLSQERVSVGPERGGSSWMLERTYGLRPDLLAMTQAWHTDDPSTSLIAAKGAPEAIAGLSRLSADDLARVRRAADEMGARGLRVLGIAQAFASHPLPDSQRDFSFEFLGLVGLADPLRAAVPDAMRECRSAGIRVIMITGDYPVTARAIARQAGIDSERVISGQELTSLSESELESEVGRTSVFARIMPQQKLRIVNALKVNGEVVAMTGDGVNDAPSLKAAHIGVAMGGRGTDVAREASSIVLLDDDFRSIVQAVRLGRRIYDNLRKAMGFIFAVHVPIAGLAILPLALGLPILFGPVHIAFLEMIIDPVCSLAFEAETEERNIMRRPPRRPEEPLFSLPFVAWSILQGAVGFGAVAAAYLLAINGGMPEAEVRALAFFSLVMVIISLILVNRSFSASILTALDRPNRALGLVVLFAMTVLSLTLLWPTARDLFRFGPLHPDDLGITLALAAAVLITLELLKYVLKRSLRGAKAPASAG